MKIDLHSHSCASDGALTPARLVERAHQHGVQMLALTDHDTLAGLDEATKAAAELGVQLVPGVEISSQWAKRNLHVLGLGIDPANPVLQALLETQGNARDIRAQAIGAKLEKLGFPGGYQGAKTVAGESTVGRPHFARWLVAEQGLESEVEAFNRYLGNGKPCDISLHWAELPAVIDAILAAGGVPVLAHPGKYQLSWSKLRLLLGEFAALGGLGMEVAYGGERPDHCRYLNQLAEQFGLEASAGSDFHSSRYTWTEIGRFPVLKAYHRPVWSRWLAQG